MSVRTPWTMIIKRTPLFRYKKDIDNFCTADLNAITFNIFRPWNVFSQWLSMISVNERRRYICNVFSYWLRPCSAIEKNRDRIHVATNDIYSFCRLSIYMIYKNIYIYIVRCRYNAVHFLQNSHNRHPIARPWGPGKGYLLWVWNLINVLLLSSQCYMWYPDKLDRVITALECMWILIQKSHIFLKSHLAISQCYFPPRWKLNIRYFLQFFL